VIRFLLPLLILIILIFEGIFAEVLPAEKFGVDYQFIPRFTLVAFLCVSAYFGQSHAVILAFIFGFLFDITYSDIIGINMFLFPFVTYVVSSMLKVMHVHLFILLFIAAFGVTLLELLNYGLYTLIGLQEVFFPSLFYERLLPTLVLNTVFLILIHYPFRHLLLKLSDLKKQDA
jgi:rod shape-determining protein MreD